MKNTLQTHPGEKATIFGWCYILAQQFLIPQLLIRGFEALNLPLTSLWVNFAYFTLNFVVVVVVFRKFLAAGLRQLGKRFGHVFGNSVAAFLLFTAANVFVNLIIALFFPSHSNANDAYIETLADEQFWVMFVGVVVLAPLAEEVLFRGVVFGTLYRWNRPLAYIFSSLFFGGIHIAAYLLNGSYTWTEAAVSMLQYLPAGLCLAWVYADTNTIFAPILVHVTVNIIAVSAMR